MLEVNDLKYIKNIPNENDITLSKIAEFFEKYLAHRTYEIKLENGTNLTMNITPNNFCHLLGLHSFKIEPIERGNRLLTDSSNLESFKGFLNVLRGNIKLEDLKNIRDSSGDYVYNKMKYRILGLPLIYQMIRKSE